MRKGIRPLFSFTELSTIEQRVAYSLAASPVSSWMLRCTRAGDPKAMELDGMLLFTTEFDPMITLSPMVTPGKTVQLAPIHTSRPILMP